MSHAVYEFPLNEKVRTYLRLEHIFVQLKQGTKATEEWQFINFFDSLFTLLDLLERLDLRNDILKDIETQEKNLVHWSQHPNIDNHALQVALQRIVRLRDQLKTSKKLGSTLKEDRFLASIRQRFSIPGGTCSFDLPNLHFWLKQPAEVCHKQIDSWMQELLVICDAIDIVLSFLRESGRFAKLVAEKGFYQGIAEDRSELIRVHCATDQGYYPILSGNKYRYAIRFMLFVPSTDGSAAVDSDVEFQLASC